MSSEDISMALVDRSPTDPLDVLGVSTFIHILSFTPFETVLQCEQVSRSWSQAVQLHEKGIWRTKCHQTGVELERMQELTEKEYSTPASGTSVDQLDSPEDGMSVDSEIVEWRRVCREFVETDRNWRYGRCRERFHTPPDNNVWRFKVDHEQETLLSTSKSATHGGLLVCDLMSSDPLFTIHGVRSYAHLEFTNGFVIFDVGREAGRSGLQVYRTQFAIDRSPHRSALPGHKPVPAHRCVSTSDPHWDPKTHVGPLPRGHLAFFRSINPPTACHAFRARVDNEGHENQRALLGMASDEAAYIWDLEDAEYRETIPFRHTGQMTVQYIEFDERFVFLCGIEQLHIYSRQTRSLLTSFPDRVSILSLPYLAYEALDLEEDIRLLPLTSRDVVTLGSTAVGRTEAVASRRDEQSWKEIMHDAVGIYGDGFELNFLACHYTPTDLISSTLCGAVIIVRDYQKVFAAATTGERDRLLTENTIWIHLGQSANLISTHLTRVTVVTTSRIIFFDTSSLPPTPMAANEHLMPLRIHTILSTCAVGIGGASCVQMDRDNIYATYHAKAEVVGDLRGFTNPRTGELVPTPEEALAGEGICVKTWNFAASVK